MKEAIVALNPLRDALSHLGRNASQLETPFKAEAQILFSTFQSHRADLERKVRHGDLTPKIAREQAAQAAADLKRTLRERAEGYSSVPKVFLNRLVEASEALARARRSQSMEELQRDTNRLLRDVLIEQQLQNRVVEFEGKTFLRPMHGGPATPTLDSLLAFHRQVDQAGDEAAKEWARRQLEGMRPKVVEPEDQRRIDLACDRPDRLNPRIVERYVEVMEAAPVEALESFVAESLADRDANACAAAFVLARQAPGGTSVRWVRQVLEGLNQFPETSLQALRTWEAEARREDADAAIAHADYTATLAETEARFPGLEAPSASEVERLARFHARPLADPPTPIGLGLQRRGMSTDEFLAVHPEPAGMFDNSEV
jgi:hypothetical protein